jgi:hypothetical protein
MTCRPSPESSSTSLSFIHWTMCSSRGDVVVFTVGGTDTWRCGGSSGLSPRPGYTGNCIAASTVIGRLVPGNAVLAT